MPGWSGWPARSVSTSSAATRTPGTARWSSPSPCWVRPTARGATPPRRPDRGRSSSLTGPLGGSLLGRHLDPKPRIAEALALHEVADLHAMIDLSDGLASDLSHILTESGGLGALLDVDAIPIHPAALDPLRPATAILASSTMPWAAARTSVCLTGLQHGRCRPCLLRRARPTGVGLHRCTARADDGPGLRLRHADGRVLPCLVRGFDHLNRNSRRSGLRPPSSPHQSRWAEPTLRERLHEAGLHTRIGHRRPWAAPWVGLARPGLTIGLRRSGGLGAGRRGSSGRSPRGSESIRPPFPPPPTS